MQRIKEILGNLIDHSPFLTCKVKYNQELITFTTLHCTIQIFFVIFQNTQFNEQQN